MEKGGDPKKQGVVLLKGRGTHGAQAHAGRDGDRYSASDPGPGPGANSSVFSAGVGIDD